MTRPWGRWLLDRGDGSLDLRLQAAWQWRVAEVRQLALRVSGGEVRQEVLDDCRLVGRQTFAAHDLVGHEQRWVSTRLGSGVLQIKTQVIAAALDLGLRYGL